MKVNSRLKIETYPENGSISGENWSVAFLGYDGSLNKKVAITTDRVRASEMKGMPIDYARLFASSPKLLEKSKKVVQDIYAEFHDKNRIPDSVLELTALIDEIENED